MALMLPLCFLLYQPRARGGPGPTDRQHHVLTTHGIPKLQAGGQKGLGSRQKPLNQVKAVCIFILQLQTSQNLE